MAKRTRGSRLADGRPAEGDDSIVGLDPEIGNQDVEVQDAKGRWVADPVFIILGHELIHARHIAAGTLDPRKAPNNAYRMREEERTIATDEISENDLRREHGLATRHVHQARDRRYGRP